MDMEILTLMDIIKNMHPVLFFKKGIKIIFYCFTLLLILPSCEKDADVKLPDVEPKLVVSSFISPQDSLIQVSVSLSSPLYNNPNISNEYKPLLNATVTISNGINSYTLPYNSNLKRYTADSTQFKIIGGLTYYLSVKSLDGKSASATTTVPLLNNTLTYTVIKNNSSENKYTLQGSWSDNDLTNFNNYRFEMFYTAYQIYSWYADTAGFFTDSVRYWRSNRILTTDTEGATFNKELQFTYSANSYDTAFTSLTTMSKEYLDYTSKLDVAVNSFSGPFSEPVQMYTNINGGLGVFAGYNIYIRRVFP
jgi:hypothetical protein